jgi:hypothetical protein
MVFTTFLLITNLLFKQSIKGEVLGSIKDQIPSAALNDDKSHWRSFF